MFALCLLLSACVLFAGGSKDQTEPERVVTTVCGPEYAAAEWFNNMNAAFEAETGIHVDVQPTPGEGDEHDAKVNIDLLAGGTIDVIPSTGDRRYQTRVAAGFLMPLNDVLEERGYDAEAVYGANLPVEDDGYYYGLPFKQELYCVFYNKDIFDNAGVPYPEGPWTWDDYVETAKKLTDPKKGIYGSFMDPDNPWYYFPAKQQDIPLYKEDGTCNFDTPEMREAVVWFRELGNTLKVQMSVEEMLAENASWNYYALAGDVLAMSPQGNWFTRLLNSQVDYPRDWKYGIAPLPSAPDGGANNLASMSFVAINKNAEHLDEAVEYVLWLADNRWKFEGGIPAMAEFTEEVQQQVFASIAEASDGQITVEDLYNGLIDTGLGVAQFDILGTASTEYNAIVVQELQAFNLELQSLDETMARITTRVNEVIANAE